MTLHSYRLDVFGRLADPTMDTPVISDVFGTIGWPMRVTHPIVFEEELNDAGTLEFELDLYHEAVTRANFQTGVSEVYLYRDDDTDPIWGGRIWVADVRDHTVRFKAYGWLFDLGKREVEEDYASIAPSPKDLYRIVHDLVADTQDSDDLGITEFEDYTSTTLGITRKIVICAEERAKVLDIIEDLSDTKFDFAIDPLKVLRLYAHRGSVTSVATLNAATNVSDFGYTEDATGMATQVAGIGEKEECEIPAVYVTDDGGAQDTYGLLQESVTPDHGEDQDHVEDAADEALRYRVLPRLQPELTLLSALNDSLETGGVALEDIELGDVVTVQSSRGAAGGWGTFNADFRVLMRRVEVANPGYETITYGVDQVTP